MRVYLERTDNGLVLRKEEPQFGFPVDLTDEEEEFLRRYVHEQWLYTNLALILAKFAQAGCDSIVQYVKTGW